MCMARVRVGGGRRARGGTNKHALVGSPARSGVHAGGSRAWEVCGAASGVVCCSSGGVAVGAAGRLPCAAGASMPYQRRRVRLSTTVVAGETVIGSGVCAEGEGEVPLGESLDDGDARRFPLRGVMLPPIFCLPLGVKTLSFLGREMAAFSASYSS